MTITCRIAAKRQRHVVPRPRRDAGDIGNNDADFARGRDTGETGATWAAMSSVYLIEGKVLPEIVENMRSWPHSGFRADQLVFLTYEDIDRLLTTF